MPVHAADSGASPASARQAFFVRTNDSRSPIVCMLSTSSSLSDTSSAVSMARMY